MKFFNTKEEVIDIELTQVGKRKLAKGRFKPKFYAFFDEDILYDAAYAGTTEPQNGAVVRIKENTPRLKTQYIRCGIETNFQKLMDQMRHGSLPNNEAMDGNTPFLPLGNSAGNEHPPAWNVFLVDGQITQPVLNYSASYGSQPIPQIYSSIEIKTQVEFDESMAVYQEPDNPEEDSEQMKPGRPLTTSEYDRKGVSTTQPQFYTDGSFLKTLQTGVILDIAEVNSDFVDENFELEVFEVIAGERGEVLRPLFVAGTGKQPSTYSTEASLAEMVLDFDSSYAAHYIDIAVDGELDEAALAKINGHEYSKANSQLGKNFGMTDGFGDAAAQSPYGSGDAFGQLDTDSGKDTC